VTLVGLRIDVDTLRGTRRGVPRLVSLLGERKIRAGFFFSVGPDNMGRHLWRLLRPAFLLKMLRSGAPGLYGLDILFKGTFWPGPLIGPRSEEALRAVALAGHEIGLHAWDHQGWQRRIAKMDEAEVASLVGRGVAELTRILGQAPECFAAPAWRVSAAALQALEPLPFRYRSDCRGNSPFYPLLRGGSVSKIPQIPATLPTYDEMVGRICNRDNYNETLLGLIKTDAFNVLTIHAEAEGISCAEMFAEFLDMAAEREIFFCPPGELLEGRVLPVCRLEESMVDGREGLLSVQGKPEAWPQASVT